MLFEQKGYSKEWIDKRLRGIAIKQNLTDEWKERGITRSKDYAILTAEISKATFGMTPAEYRNYKNLPSKSKENLRDNMNDKIRVIYTSMIRLHGGNRVNWRHTIRHHNRTTKNYP